MAVMFAVATTASVSCVDKDTSKQLAESFQAAGSRPDEAPAIVNKELPFRYPAALYARKVQGNVTLRLYVDSVGRVHPESTRVEESSGYGSLDSAAVRGSQQLEFSPAKLRGQPVGTSILFPVYFRHPGAAPLPGDTILKKAP